MEEFSVGTLLPGATRITNGNINPVWRGNVQLEGFRRQMYVKFVTPRTLAVEVICALMGRALKLPIPKPAIVYVAPESLEGQGFLLEKEAIFFGAESVDNPDLKQWVSQSSEGFEVITRWAKIIDAGCFDEWIANHDRHGGNILYGGGTNFSLIDHSEALGKHIYASTPAAQNTLLQIASNRKSEVQRTELYRKAAVAASPFGAVSIDAAIIATLDLATSTSEAGELVRLLAERIEHLMMLISARIGHKQTALALNR